MSVFSYDPIHPGDTNPPAGVQQTTPNYNLPLWQNNTVTSWLVQLNYAMQTIDTVMHNLALRTSIDGTVPPELFSTVEKLEQDVAELKNVALRVTHAEESITNLQTQMANLLSDVNTLRINYVNLDTRMSTAESSIQNLQGELDKIQENVNSNTATLTAIESRVSNLENPSS